MLDPTIFERLLDTFKQYPGILALLFVIYWLFRLLYKKDETIKELLQLSKVDIERSNKLLILLEILVSRGNK